MKKFGIIAFILIVIIGATAVLAQSFSTNTSTSSSSPNVIQTNNQTEINVPSSMLSSIKTITNKDANIRRVEVTDDKTIIDYQEHTKIFGIFPAKFNLRLAVNPAKKQVNLSRPWWTIFGNTRVSALLQEARSGLDTLKLDNAMDQRAKIIQTLSNILRKTSETNQAVTNNIK